MQQGRFYIWQVVELNQIEAPRTMAPSTSMAQSRSSGCLLR